VLPVAGYVQSKRRDGSSSGTLRAFDCRAFLHMECGGITGALWNTTGSDAVVEGHSTGGGLGAGTD
jgi:hypothetical protein